MVTQTIRSRWFAVAVHSLLWLIALLTALRLTTRMPQYRETKAHTMPPQLNVPAERLANMFSPSTASAHIAWSNGANPFHTRHFVPPPTPAPPPPPTTRKVEVTYQGFFLSSDRVKHAIVKVSTNFQFIRLGARVETNIYVAEATAAALTLTNHAAQTNLLPLNVKTQIEVPL